MSRSAKYLEVYKHLKADILSEVYPTGTFLPTETDLMEKYGASRTTIRHAIALLKDERVIDVCQGRGTQVILHDKSQQNSFVLFHNVTDVSNSFKIHGEPRVNTQGGIISIVAATGDVALALEVDEGTMVYRLERLSLLNDIPFSYQINYLYSHEIQGFEKFSGQIEVLHNLYQFLEREYRIQFSSGQETISAIAAAFFDAKLLEVEAGTPLLLFNRISTFTRQTKEYTQLITRPDIINVTVTMSGPPSYFG